MDSGASKISGPASLRTLLLLVRPPNVLLLPSTPKTSSSLYSICGDASRMRTSHMPCRRGDRGNRWNSERGLRKHQRSVQERSVAVRHVVFLLHASAQDTALAVATRHALDASEYAGCSRVRCRHTPRHRQFSVDDATRNATRRVDNIYYTR